MARFILINYSTKKLPKCYYGSDIGWLDVINKVEDMFVLFNENMTKTKCKRYKTIIKKNWTAFLSIKLQYTKHKFLKFLWNYLKLKYSYWDFKLVKK